MEVMYKAVATSVGGRNGNVKTEDGFVNLNLKTPKGMGGEGGGANPEDLFASGFAACYNSAVAMAARNARMEIGDVTVMAEVGVGPNGSGGFKFVVKLQVNIPGVDMKTAKEIANKAEYICPFSNAIRGNVDLEVSVTNG